MTVEPGIEIANNALGIINVILEKVNGYKRIQEEKSALLRLIYLEVINNLEVLKTIDFDRLSSLLANDIQVKQLTTLLQTDMMEVVFYISNDAENKEIYQLMLKRGKIKNKENALVKIHSDGREKVFPGKSFIYENIVQAFSFVFTKIEILRKLSALDAQGIQPIKKLYLKSRFININQRFLMIKNVMEGFEEIKDMRR